MKLWLLTLAFGLFAQSAAAAPSSIAQCTSAYEAGVSARRRGALLSAETSFAACAPSSCPAALASLSAECARFAQEVKAEIPVVVVTATDDDGSEVALFNVAVDDAPAERRAAGQEIAVDPGPHVLRFSHRGRSAEATVDVPIGGRRRIIVRLPSASKPAKAPRAREDESRPADDGPRDGHARPITWAAAGTGLVGLGVFGVFSLSGMSQQADLEGRCPRCTQSEIDGVRSKYLAADLGLLVGVVALGAAAYLYFAHDRSAAPR